MVDIGLPPGWKLLFLQVTIVNVDEIGPYILWGLNADISINKDIYRDTQLSTRTLAYFIFNVFLISLYGH